MNNLFITVAFSITGFENDFFVLLLFVDPSLVASADEAYVTQALPPSPPLHVTPSSST